MVKTRCPFIWTVPGRCTCPLFGGWGLKSKRPVQVEPCVCVCVCVCVCLCLRCTKNGAAATWSRSRPCAGRRKPRCRSSPRASPPRPPPLPCPPQVWASKQSVETIQCLRAQTNLLVIGLKKPRSQKCIALTGSKVPSQEAPRESRHFESKRGTGAGSAGGGA